MFSSVIVVVSSGPVSFSDTFPLLDAQPDTKIDATNKKVSISMPSFFKVPPQLILTTGNSPADNYPCANNYPCADNYHVLIIIHVLIITMC